MLVAAANSSRATAAATNAEGRAEFATWTAGTRTNNACVYVDGPQGQTGTVQLTGPSAGLPATRAFTLDANGQAMVVFNVNSSASYSYTVTRSGSSTHMGTVTVPTMGNGSPPPSQFSQTPCPAAA